MYDDTASHNIAAIMSTPDAANNSNSTPRVQAVKELLFSELNEEAVILNLKNGKYYGLNAVGVSIWAIVQKPVTHEEIESAIMSEYDVDEDTCRLEVKSFLERMTAEELIQTID